MTGLKFILFLEEVKDAIYARKIGVSTSIVSRWGKGTKPMPDDRIEEFHNNYPYCPLELISKQLTPNDILTLSNEYVLNRLESAWTDV